MKNLKKTRGFVAFLKRHVNDLFLLGIAFMFFTIGAFLVWASFIKLPDFNNFNERKVVESTKIYDRTGEILLYDVHQDVKRTIIPFDQISPNIKNATIAVEDANFYNHLGIEPKSIIRAIFANIFGGGYVQGGSTITQQVVKNTLLTSEKKITRKLKELILSFRLEHELTKDQILALYLNEIPYGGNIYGVSEASRVFFGKKPSDLTIAESAYIASLPKAPTRLSPYGNNTDKLEQRKNFVLFREKTIGLITEDQYKTALNEKVIFLPRESRGIKAPHFVLWVREYLAEKYGEQTLEESGFRVITSLDYKLQEKAQDVVDKFGPDNEQKFGAKNMGLIAINPKNGQILAMVGSRDYFDIKNNGNFNVTLAPNRQPGSTFKPFVYATGFKKGFTPETTIFDLKTNFNTNCNSQGIPIYQGIKPEDCYVPENYDGKYRGPVSIREALAQSLNVPAVKTLYLAGLKDSITTARSMGITSLNDPARYGLTLVLGGGEVSLLELTGGYSVFANDGVLNPPTSILRIEDKQGNILEEFTDKSSQVIPSEVAREINDILSDNKARTPAFGSNSPLYFPNADVAAKTGTTNDYRDVWTIGHTPNITVGMWAGNNDNSPMHKNVAGMIISPVWRAYMDEALKLTPSENFIKPEEKDLTNLPAPLQGIWKGGEKYTIDTASGKLATENTPQEMKKVVVVPEIHNILHWVNKNNPIGPAPSNPTNDPQYNLWEAPVRAWVMSQGINEGDRSEIPTGYDTSRNINLLPKLSLTGTDLTLPHKKSEIIEITIGSTGGYALNKVELFINGKFIEQRSANDSFTFKVDLGSLDNLETENEITIVGYDTILNKAMLTQKLILE